MYCAHFGHHNSRVKWTIWTAKRLIKHLKVMTFGEGENTLRLLSLQKKKKRKFRGDTVTVFEYVLPFVKDD